MASPKLRFKEFDGDWDLKNLGDCFSLFSGYAFPSSASVDNGTKWLKIADVGIQEMTPNNLSFLPNNFTTKFPQFIVSKNDYVIALTRPILNKKLKIAKVGEFYDGALLNQRVAKIVSENNNLDFIYSLLQKSKTVEELENSIAGTDPPNLSLNEVKGIVLGIPKVEEQTKIASFLSAVDEKINQLTQKHELLSQYKQGMMQKLFSQQIRFKSDDGSEFGEWEEKLLKDYFPKIRNGFVGVATPYYAESGVKYLQGKNIKNGKIDSTGIIYINSEFHQKKTNSILKINDILMVQSGHVGECAVVTREYDNGNCHALLVLSPISTQIVNSQFVVYYFYSELGKKTITLIKTGNTIEHILASDIKEVSMLFPCLEEQTKIANFLSAIDQKIEVVAQQIEQAKQWKKGLLQQMFV